MTLGQKQRRFALMVAHLIQHAYLLGYEITLGDAYRDPRSHGAMGESGPYGARNSKHKQRLAIDLNLFRNGRYLTSTKAHAELGAYWETLGGTWGGNFPNPDGNHYQFG